MTGKATSTAPDFSAEAAPQPVSAPTRPRHDHTGFRLSVAAVLGVLIALLSAAFWMRLPVPEDAIAITTLDVSMDGGPFEQVALPHPWPRAGGDGHRLATYRFTVARTPGETAFLLIPGLRHELSVQVDGQSAQPTRRAAGNHDSLGSTYVLRLFPTSGSESEIELRLERVAGYAPGYLSVMHLATPPAFESVRPLWQMAQSDFQLATRVLHGIVVLSVWLMLFWRREDPVFVWMALLAGASFLADHLLTFFAVIELRLFTVSGFGLIAYAFALALVGAPRPRWLKAGIVLVPTLLVAGVQIGVLPELFVLALSGLFAIVLCFLGTLLLLRHAFARGEWDMAAMAGFFATTVWYGLHDFGLALGWIDGAWFLSHHMRTFGLLVVLLLLMRWLAGSLNAVDRANATLRTRLAEQKQQLNLLHQKEQGRIQEDARHDERQRLMRDLHDGLSGHLVSIIALSETGTLDAALVENTARAALDDLRLVINALDLEDDDLRLALSGLRERAEPQMARLGIGLEWSMAQLPDVRGIKPGNSLAILRILQEALTNAIKHRADGPIAVTAEPFADDMVCVSVTNQSPLVQAQGHGHGMRNMQLRAAELGGEVRFCNSAGLARLSLIFPRDLDAPAR